jgi:hypothetical protein
MILDWDYIFSTDETWLIGSFCFENFRRLTTFFIFIFFNIVSVYFIAAHTCWCLIVISL